jgi:hypothetical protein
LVALDLGGSGGDSSALTPVQIGSVSVGQETEVTAPSSPTTFTSTGSSLHQPGSTSGSGSDSSLGQAPVSTSSQGGAAGPASTIRAGKTTVVTGEIRVQPGPGYQGGSTTTTQSEGPNPTAHEDDSPTTTAPQATTSTGGAHGSTSTAGTRGPSTTGGSSGGSTGGVHGPASTGQGR